jgi:hypothetical protein
LYSDLVAVRSENKRISLIDLTPIHKTCFDIPAQEGMGSSLSWSPKGQFLATIAGDEILVTDSRYGFNQVASIKLEGCELRRVAFCPVEGGDSEDGQGGLILLAAVGLDGKLHMLQFSPVGYNVELLSSIFVEENLWVVAWSGGTVFKAVLRFCLSILVLISPIASRRWQTCCDWWERQALACFFCRES